jgi:threonyl-tRNA synthetase
MIHRAILGSFERFIGILTEHTYAEFPFAIAPTQVIIIPINETHTKYAQTLQKELLYNEIDAIVFNQNESLNKRIRIAEKQKVPFIVVIGDNEVKDESVALRDRRNRTQEVLSKNNFLDKVKKLREVEL